MFVIQAILWCLQALGLLLLVVGGILLAGGVIFAVRVSYTFFEYLLIEWIWGDEE